MRILHVYDHLGKNSGVVAVMMNWLRSVDREDVQFDFLIGYHREPSYEEEVLQLNGNVFRMSESAVFGIKQLPEIARNVKSFMRAHVGEYDVIHLHTLTFSYPYLYYAKKYGAKRTICHIHGSQLGRTWLTGLRNWAMVQPLRFLADDFMACSQLAGEKICSLLGEKDFKWIPNGVDFSKYNLGKDTRQCARKSLGIPEETFAVCHISNMTEIKNVPFAVRVFAQIAKERPDSKLLLVGRDILPEGVAQEVRIHGLEDKVINLGVRSDVPELLAASDVCLMPSQSEGFGLVALESQLAGTPVVVSGGFPQEVLATELAVMEEMDESRWADTAMRQTPKAPESVRDELKQFDCKYIVKQVIDYYMDR